MAIARRPFAKYSESELVGAIKASWAEIFRFLARSSRAELDERAGLTRFSCAVPLAFFNGVFRTYLAPGSVDAAIEDTIAYFTSRDVPAFGWWLMPDQRPADLDEFLQAHGFAFQTGASGMAVDLAAVNQDLSSPAGLRIQVVDDEKAFARWSPVSATCFGFTDYEAHLYDLWMDVGFDLPLRHYLGLLNGRAVATSTLFLAAGVAGVYSVATLPKARRQGIGAAMTLAPLLDARDLGYSVGVLQASQMGYPVYRRVGFQEYCKMNHYVWKREAESV